jgi:hypothetical protein
MNNLTQMDRSVGTILGDLGHVHDRIRELEELTGMLGAVDDNEEHRLRMKEVLSDLRLRAEGIESFVRSCRQRVQKDTMPEEDTDLWI